MKPKYCIIICSINVGIITLKFRLLQTLYFSDNQSRAKGELHKNQTGLCRCIFSYSIFLCKPQVAAHSSTSVFEAVQHFQEG